MSLSGMFIVFPAHYMALSRPPGNRMPNFVHNFSNLVFSSPYLTTASSYSSLDPPSWLSLFMLMISSSLGLMRLFCTRLVLCHTFFVKDLGHTSYFLGAELARSSHDLNLTQHKYTVDIIYNVFLASASSTSTPLPKSISNGKAPFRVPKVINGTSNSILEPQIEPIVFYHSNHSLQMSIYFNILLYF